MTPILTVLYGQDHDAFRDRYFTDNTKNNIGYTRAMNGLIRVAIHGNPSEAFIVLANPDVQFFPETIAKAVQFMDSHPRCAVAGFKQLDPFNHDQITHAGCTDAWPAGVHLVGRVSNGDHAVSKQVPWVNGAAVIWRREALEQLDLFDEGFFLYGQDSDICYRARLKGWEVWYCAEAECLHGGGGGCAKEPTPEQAAILAKDVEYWARKWSAILHGARTFRHEQAKAPPPSPQA